MNERIKELIKEMGIIPEDEHYEVAELIVKECAGICERDKTGHRDSDSVKQGLADMIKQHFGVE